MIITPEQIRLIRPIAENVNDIKRLVPYIDECEKLFILPALGAKQYKAIQTDVALNETGEPLTDNSGSNLLVGGNELTELFDGCYYDSDTKHCEGLIKAMGYLVYSRFVRNQNVNVTAFGIVKKDGQFSEAVDDKTIIRIANDAEKIGLEYLRQCVNYLNFGKEKADQRNIKPRIKFKAIGD
ncbi:MAG: hypothetical protein WCG93_10145 [Paludibacter sp.]